MCRETISQRGNDLLRITQEIHGRQSQYLILSSVFKKVNVKVQSLSHVQLFVTPWTVAHQALPSMEFFRQEYCNGLPCPSPGDLHNPGIKPRSFALHADFLPFELPRKPLCSRASKISSIPTKMAKTKNNHSAKC